MYMLFRVEKGGYSGQKQTQDIIQIYNKYIITTERTILHQRGIFRQIPHKNINKN